MDFLTRAEKGEKGIDSILLLTGGFLCTKKIHVTSF